MKKWPSDKANCACKQLYITNNTKRFSFKSGRSVCVAKLTKTDWLVVLQLEFRLNTTLYFFKKSFITKVPEY